MPGAVTQEMPSTAAAASYVSEANDKTIAAIAAPGAAELYGLTVLAENVQITDTNKTRFYVLAASRLQTEGQRNAVFAVSCEANQIDDIIAEIHNTGAELVTLHDRPEGSQLGSYHYIIEIEKETGLTDSLIEKIAAIQDLRFLGSFDVEEK
ncbi:MAG: hypothetical protein J6P72_07160 [Firmicutes bacterium]|nr:hypothetical protein [Bacillota bacterium]